MTTLSLETKSQIRTVLSFDYGLTKIGIATGTTILRTASPLTIIAAKHGIPDWQHLTQKIINVWRPDALVVGLPLNMDGSSSIMSKRATEFSASLKKHYNKPCFLCDERLTTRYAKDFITENSTKQSLKNKPVDALAASFILQQWLEANYS